MRKGVTLMELVVVLVIIGAVCAIGVPRLLAHIDRARVRHAMGEVVTALALARTSAVARNEHVTTHFDAVGATVTVSAGSDTILTRALGEVHGVRIRSNRDSAVYGPGGLGYGAANQTVVVERGSAIDSIVIARLGRVRR